MQPLVSLIMTVYNRESYLAQAIESALAQTEPNYELIIVDDGSSDGSVSIAQRYANAHQHIRLIKAKHQGRGYALSTAFSFASGQYLALLDSDDWLAPTALAETVTVLDAFPDVSMVYSNYVDVNESGELLNLGHRCHIRYSKERLLLDFMTFHFRLFRRSAYEQIGGIDPTFEYAPDYDLSLKLSEVGEVVHLEKPLYYYRIHSNSISVAKRLEQVRFSHRAVEQAISRRGLSEHVSVEVQLRPRLAFKRKPFVSHSQKQKVFGIGLGKTGTTSLCMALAKLGYKTIHLPQSVELLENYDAAADISVAIAFRELDWRYPQAKFVLTLRPVAEWLVSWENHDQTIRQKIGGELPDWMRRLRIRTFGQVKFEAAVWQRTYEQHYQEVTHYFKGRSQQLLEYNLCASPDWAPLCKFLSKPVPSLEFPHGNKMQQP